MQGRTLTLNEFNARISSVPGTRFLEGLELIPATKSRNARVLLRCACGNESEKDMWNTLSGLSRSCGCMGRGACKGLALRNTDWSFLGDVALAEIERMHRRWKCMVKRCHTPTDKAFKNYGGRGIAVCDQWRKSFLQFITDMGLPPSPELSIDRINNDGNYEPDNCRWATAKQQAQNRRLRPKRET